MEKLSVSVNGSMGILLSCGIPCAGMEDKMKNGLRKMTLVTGILCAMSVTLCACSGDEPAVNQEERQTDADDLNVAADDLSPELPAGDNTDGADGDAPKEQEDVQGASGAWEDSAPALEGDIKELQDGCLTVVEAEISTDDDGGVTVMATPAPGADDSEFDKVTVTYDEKTLFAIKTIYNGGAEFEMEEATAQDLEKGRSVEVWGDRSTGELKATQICILKVV